MCSNTDPQKEEDQFYAAANRGAGESLLGHQISRHLPTRKTGGPDWVTGIQNSGNVRFKLHLSKVKGWTQSLKNRGLISLKCDKVLMLLFSFIFLGVVSEQKGQVSSPSWLVGVHEGHRHPCRRPLQPATEQDGPSERWAHFHSSSYKFSSGFTHSSLVI